VTLSKTRNYLKLLQNVLLKRKASFDSLPISKTKYDNLHILINNKMNSNKFSYVLYNSLCLFVCSILKRLFDFNIVFLKNGFYFAES
jgi:hypothetical protein